MKRKPEDIIWDFFAPAVSFFFSPRNWLSFIFSVMFTSAWSLLDHTLGESWFTIAFMGYVLTQAFLHGAITLNTRVRSGKWPGPRLHLTLINLGVFAGLAITVVLFSGANPAALPAFAQAALFVVGIGAYEYYKNYRRNRRAVADEFQRFKSELGIGE